MYIHTYYSEQKKSPIGTCLHLAPVRNYGRLKMTKWLKAYKQASMLLWGKNGNCHMVR